MGKFEEELFIQWSGIFSLQWDHVFSFFSLFSFQISIYMEITSFYSLFHYIAAFHLYNFKEIIWMLIPLRPFWRWYRRDCELWNIVQVSFLHKCGQFSWCSALNVKMTITFLDISSFRCLHSSIAFSPRTSYLNAYGSLIIFG